MQLFRHGLNKIINLTQQTSLQIRWHRSDRPTVQCVVDSGHVPVQQRAHGERRNGAVHEHTGTVGYGTMHHRTVRKSTETRVQNASRRLFRELSSRKCVK